MPPLPMDLQVAIEHGELTNEQLRELIRLEAMALGMSFEEAVRRAHERSLPKNYIGSDIELLVELLPAA
jgi:hypothetical protein